MTLVRISGPDAEPVTVSSLKAYLRLTHDSEDDLLAGLIRAAREDVERATGLVLLGQSWRLVLDAWPDSGTTLLMKHPVREVLSVTAYDQEGEPVILSASAWEADTLSRPARVRLTGPVSSHRVMNGVEIAFAAGFGEAGPDVPATLCHAITLLAAHWYEFRATYRPEDQPVSYPPHYERLVAAYREHRI